MSWAADGRWHKVLCQVQVKFKGVGADLRLVSCDLGSTSASLRIPDKSPKPRLLSLRLRRQSERTRYCERTRYWLLTQGKLTDTKSLRRWEGWVRRTSES